MKSEKKHLINVLKVLAFFLIINSHSDALFPDQLKALATGGALGNGVFFLISGYFTHEKRNCWKDVVIRFLRLYLPVYIVILLCSITEHNYLRNINSFKSWFELFIWPTPYWFVSAAFFSFILLDVCKRWTGNKQFVFFTLSIAAVYVLNYIFGIQDKSIWIVEDGKVFGLNIHFKCVYCFYLYSLGFHIKTSKSVMCGRDAISMSVVCFVLTYLIKMLMQEGILSMKLQYLTQICVIGFSVGTLYVALYYEDACKKCKKSIVVFFDSVSKISLEAYVVQILLIPIIARWCPIVFPLNYIIAIILIISISYCLYYIDNKAISYTKRLLNKEYKNRTTL